MNYWLNIWTSRKFRRRRKSCRCLFLRLSVALMDLFSVAMFFFPFLFLSFSPPSPLSFSRHSPLHFSLSLSLSLSLTLLPLCGCMRLHAFSRSFLSMLGLFLFGRVLRRLSLFSEGILEGINQSIYSQY